MSRMDATVFNENKCVICLGELSSRTEKATIVKTGIPNLVKYSQQQGDVSLEVCIETQRKKNPPGKVLVHASCRREYTDAKRTKRPNAFVICLFLCFIHNIGLKLFNKLNIQILKILPHVNCDTHYSLYNYTFEDLLQSKLLQIKSTKLMHSI